MALYGFGGPQRYGIPEASYPYYGGGYPPQTPPPPPPQQDPYQQGNQGPRRYGIPEIPNPTITAPPAPPPQVLPPPSLTSQQMRTGGGTQMSSLMPGQPWAGKGNIINGGYGRMYPRGQGVQNISAMGGLQGMQRSAQPSVGFRNPMGLSPQRGY